MASVISAMQDECQAVLAGPVHGETPISTTAATAAKTTTASTAATSSATAAASVAAPSPSAAASASTAALSSPRPSASPATPITSGSEAFNQSSARSSTTPSAARAIDIVFPWNVGRKSGSGGTSSTTPSSTPPRHAAGPTKNKKRTVSANTSDSRLQSPKKKLIVPVRHYLLDDQPLHAPARDTKARSSASSLRLGTFSYRPSLELVAAAEQDRVKAEDEELELSQQLSPRALQRQVAGSSSSSTLLDLTPRSAQAPTNSAPAENNGSSRASTQSDGNRRSRSSSGPSQASTTTPSSSQLSAAGSHTSTTPSIASSATSVPSVSCAPISSQSSVRGISEGAATGGRVKTEPAEESLGRLTQAASDKSRVLDQPLPGSRVIYREPTLRFTLQKTPPRERAPRREVAAADTADPLAFDAATRASPGPSDLLASVAAALAQADAIATQASALLDTAHGQLPSSSTVHRPTATSSTTSGSQTPSSSRLPIAPAVPHPTSSATAAASSTASSPQTGRKKAIRAPAHKFVRSAALGLRQAPKPAPAPVPEYMAVNATSLTPPRPRLKTKHRKHLTVSTQSGSSAALPTPGSNSMSAASSIPFDALNPPAHSLANSLSRSAAASAAAQERSTMLPAPFASPAHRGSVASTSTVSSIAFALASGSSVATSTSANGGRATSRVNDAVRLSMPRPELWQPLPTILKRRPGGPRKHPLPEQSAQAPSPVLPAPPLPASRLFDDELGSSRWFGPRPLGRVPVMDPSTSTSTLQPAQAVETKPSLSGLGIGPSGSTEARASASSSLATRPQASSQSAAESSMGAPPNSSPLKIRIPIRRKRVVSTSSSSSMSSLTSLDSSPAHPSTASASSQAQRGPRPPPRIVVRAAPLAVQLRAAQKERAVPPPPRTPSSSSLSSVGSVQLPAPNATEQSSQSTFWAGLDDGPGEGGLDLEEEAPADKKPERWLDPQRRLVKGLSISKAKQLPAVDAPAATAATSSIGSGVLGASCTDAIVISDDSDDDMPLLISFNPSTRARDAAASTSRAVAVKAEPDRASSVKLTPRSAHTARAAAKPEHSTTPLPSTSGGHTQGAEATPRRSARARAAGRVSFMLNFEVDEEDEDDEDDDEDDEPILGARRPIARTQSDPRPFPRSAPALRARGRPALPRISSSSSSDSLFGRPRAASMSPNKRVVRRREDEEYVNPRKTGPRKADGRRRKRVRREAGEEGPRGRGGRRKAMIKASSFVPASASLEQYMSSDSSEGEEDSDELVNRGEWTSASGVAGPIKTNFPVRTMYAGVDGSYRRPLVDDGESVIPLSKVFQPGDVIYGKIRGWRPWPAVVVAPGEIPFCVRDAMPLDPVNEIAFCFVPEGNYWKGTAEIVRPLPREGLLADLREITLFLGTAANRAAARGKRRRATQDELLLEGLKIALSPAALALWRRKMGKVTRASNRQYGPPKKWWTRREILIEEHSQEFGPTKPLPTALKTERWIRPGPGYDSARLIPNNLQEDDKFIDEDDPRLHYNQDLFYHADYIFHLHKDEPNIVLDENVVVELPRRSRAALRAFSYVDLPLPRRGSVRKREAAGRAGARASDGRMGAQSGLSERARGKQRARSVLPDDDDDDEEEEEAAAAAVGAHRSQARRTWANGVVAAAADGDDRYDDDVFTWGDSAGRSARSSIARATPSGGRKHGGSEGRKDWVSPSSSSNASHSPDRSRSRLGESSVDVAAAATAAANWRSLFDEDSDDEAEDDGSKKREEEEEEDEGVGLSRNRLAGLGPGGFTPMAMSSGARTPRYRSVSGQSSGGEEEVWRGLGGGGAYGFGASWGYGYGMYGSGSGAGGGSGSGSGGAGNNSHAPVFGAGYMLGGMTPNPAGHGSGGGGGGARTPAYPSSRARTPAHTHLE